LSKAGRGIKSDKRFCETWFSPNVVFVVTT
jgi:hypothetical protein